jgi:hypothetical protein
MKTRASAVWPCLILLASLCSVATAGDYYAQSGVLYDRVSVPYNWYKCGKCYTSYKYEYRVVTTAKDRNWRTVALDVLNNVNEAGSFDQTFAGMNLTVRSRYPSSYVQQQGIVGYPSATGTTLGGFSTYEYQRYGSGPPVDFNKAFERSSVLIDQQQRLAGEQSRIGAEAFQQTASLTNLNGERLGALAELNETKQALVQTSQTLAQVMREAYQGQAAVLRELKPKDSESGRYSSGTVPPQGNGGQQSPPDVDPPPIPPQEAITGVVDQFCGACHGRDKADGALKGGYRIFSGKKIGEREKLAILIRSDPQTPWLGQQGKPLRMPPQESPQPSQDDRQRLVVEIEAMARLQQDYVPQ